MLAIGRMENSESPNSYVTLVNFSGADVAVDISADFDPDRAQGAVVVDTGGSAG